MNCDCCKMISFENCISYYACFVIVCYDVIDKSCIKSIRVEEQTAKKIQMCFWNTRFEILVWCSSACYYFAIQIFLGIGKNTLIITAIEQKSVAIIVVLRIFFM